MRVRKAVGDDVDSIMAIHEAAIRGICSRDYPSEVIDAWLAQRQPERQRAHLATCAVWLVEDGGEVLGFGGVNLHTSRVESLFVHPSANGKGLATTILNRLEDVAFEAGCKELVLDSSLSALGFYQANGFSPTGKKSYLALSESISLAGIVMTKSLESRGKSALKR